MTEGEAKMNIDERRKYLRMMKKRYRQANRKEKNHLLTEMEAVTGLHRKSLIRLMNGSLERKPRRRERGRTYGPEVDHVLRIIYESADYICAERLTPCLVWWARHLAAHGELALSPALEEQLGQISVSTVRRRFARFRQDQPRLPRRKGRARHPWLRDIPMGRLPGDISSPGYFEVDLVHHCGPTTTGEYICTVQMIDVATGWSERRAVLGHSYLVMEDAFRVILSRLPFPVLHIHPDNGSEFFNHHILRFWGERVQGVTLSRSRPSFKNDNPRVEQKNYTLVRAYLGDERFDTLAQHQAMNHLYDQMWVYYNLFQPVLHLEEKEVIPREDAPPKIIRRYDTPRSPFDRLCATDAILPEHRDILNQCRDSINPRQLRQEIYDTLELLFSLPNAAPDVVEDVFLSLSTHQDKPSSLLSPFCFHRTPIREEETA